MKHLSTKLVRLTREFALDVATMEEWNGERGLKPHRTKMLRNRYLDGLFFPPRWSFVTINGKKIRINGKSSSSMLSGVEEPFPNMLVVVDEFQADSLEDVAKLFAQYDSGRSARTRTELAKAAGSVHSELDHISPTLLSYAVSGLTFALTDGRSSDIDPDDRDPLLHYHFDFVVWLHQFMGDRRLQRAPLIAAIYKTYHRDPLEAALFWKFVRDEDHPDRTHPSRTLATFLRDPSARPGGNRHGKQWTTIAFHVKAIHAWNAHRQGMTSTLRYYPKAPIPKVL